MPRYTSRVFFVEAHQYTGSVSALPATFAEAVVPQRQGHACLVRCGNELRPCELTDWMLRGEDGRLDVLPNGVFVQRFDVTKAPMTPGNEAGITATFHGAPNEPAHEQPSYVDWLGLRFPRGEPVPVSSLPVSSIEAIRLNSHFTVADPEPEPVDVPVRGGTLTLNKKGSLT